jgi:hypothetical protein
MERADAVRLLGPKPGTPRREAAAANDEAGIGTLDHTQSSTRDGEIDKVDEMLTRLVTDRLSTGEARRLRAIIVRTLQSLREFDASFDS